MGATGSVDLQLNTKTNAGIHIQLDKETPSYVPGETVSGTLSINEPHYQNEAVSIDLIGEVGYTMNYSTDTNVVQTIYHRSTFFKFSKASISNGEKFHLRLDEDLPPSLNIEKETSPYIRYVLQVNLSKTNKHRHWILVCPRLVIPHSKIHPVYFNAFNRKQMYLTSSLDLEWVLPGNIFQLQFLIDNPNQEHIKRMDGNITMRAKFRDIEYNEKVMDIVVDDVTDKNDCQITSTVPLSLPIRYFPPTFSYKNVSIEYWMTLEVHVRGVNTSLKTTIPIMVGFEPENITSNKVLSPDQRRLFITSSDTKCTSRKYRSILSPRNKY